MRVVLIAVPLLAAATLAAQHAKEPHQHPEAAKMKNPVAADAASLAEGKKLYAEQCVDCHGATGKGDGSMAMYTGDPQPSDFTDDVWQHGSSDGEIYAVIHDGIDETGMKNFDKDLTEQQIWHLVNYIRTFSQKPTPSHEWGVD